MWSGDAVLSQMVINNNLVCRDVPQPQSGFKVTLNEQVKVSCCSHLFERMKQEGLPPLIWLDCQWQDASFLFFSFSFWHISMFCMHRKGGLEQEMSLRRWAVHYSADSRSALISSISTRTSGSSALFLRMLSNLVPVQLWPFSKGQRNTKQAISGFFFMWPLKMSFHVNLWLRSVHAQSFTESLDSSAATSAHVFLQLNKWNYFHYYQTYLYYINLK